MAKNELLWFNQYLSLFILSELCNIWHCWPTFPILDSDLSWLPDTTLSHFSDPITARAPSLAPLSLPCFWMLVSSGVLLDSLCPHLSLGSLSRLRGFCYLLFANCLQTTYMSPGCFSSWTSTWVLVSSNCWNFKLSMSKAKAAVSPVPPTNPLSIKWVIIHPGIQSRNLKRIVNSILSLNIWNNPWKFCCTKLIDENHRVHGENEHNTQKLHQWHLKKKR